jgi:putative tryptophan/tyrosine transport system substrate-binding protein
MEYIMFRVLLTVLTSLTLTFTSISSTPYKVAIANLGPHQSLLDIIQGIEKKSKELGLDIQFDIQHINFDMTQIPKMLTAFKAKKPDVIITLTTSISQHAKAIFKDTAIPILFAAVTDPVEANLLSLPNQSCGNITGVSDKQDAASIIKFIKHTLPFLKRIGIPYSQNEANDRALLNSFQTAANSFPGLKIIPIPIDSLQDLPHRIRATASLVDALYVGPSNMIQPALPIIIQQANRSKLPVFNFNEAAVTAHQAFASFSVNYVNLGYALANLIKQLIDKTPISSISPLYPKATDHYGTISIPATKRLGISLPLSPYVNTTYLK